MIHRRVAAVLFLGLLGAAVVYSLMMAFGDPALELPAFDADRNERVFGSAGGADWVHGDRLERVDARAW